MTRQCLLALGLVVAATAGCGDAVQSAPADCEPGPEELGQTPRADENLELLALAHSDGVVADQAIYDRIVRDVSAMRALEPAIANIGYFARYEPRKLLLEVSEATFSRMQQGDYSAWDCLNSAYRPYPIA